MARDRDEVSNGADLEIDIPPVSREQADWDREVWGVTHARVEQEAEPKSSH